MNTGLALRGAVFSLLAGDATLADLAGAGRIHDGAPRGAPFPHLVIGTIESRPLLAHPEEGEEHRLEIAVFSRAASRDEAGGILSRAVDLLVEGSGMAGALAAASPGHDLVGVRLIDLRSERLVPQRLWRAGARFRLVTEPLA